MMPPKWSRLNVVPLSPLWRVRSRVTGQESTTPTDLDRARETCAILNRTFGADTYHPFPHRPGKGPKGNGPGEGPGPVGRAA